MWMRWKYNETTATRQRRQYSIGFYFRVDNHLPKFGGVFEGLPIFHILFSSSNFLTWSNEMSPILDTFLFSLTTVVLMTSQQGLTIQKYSLLTKYWMVDVLKVWNDLHISKGRQLEYSFEGKMISVCLDKNLIAWSLLWRACISTKIEDGGQFIPFYENICGSKQEMRKRWKKIICCL
jgi:hypothetical protein